MVGRSFRFNYSYLLVLVLFACARDEVSFRIDPALLGESYENFQAGVKLYMPAGWSSISQEEFSLINKKIKPGPAEKIRPLRFYYNRDRTSFCMISRFLKKEKIKEIKDRYQKELPGSSPGSTVRFGSFYKENIQIHQFQIWNDKVITVKLLFTDRENTVIELDYVLSLQAYKKEIKAIESSIGSISLI
ncbi:MAG: hypothetical protein PHF84_10575 [bacterium]|nr:hypothetical protein [bacterium]